MTWTCPSCGNIFKTRNAWHSCVKLSPEDLLLEYPDEIKKLYTLVDEYTMALGDVHRAVLKSCISYKVPVTFLTIKPARNHMHLEIFLPYKEDVFPVEKVFQASSECWVHVVPFDDPDEFDGQLKKWIEDACHFKKAL